MRALVLATLLFAACATDPCKKGTVRVTYSLPSDAAAADMLDVILDVGAGTPQTKTVARKAGDASIEIDFAAYPKGQDVSVTLVAHASGAIVAEGTAMAGADGSCLALSIDLSAASGVDQGVTGDLAPYADGGEPADDFAGQVLPDLALPPKTDLSFAPETAPSCVGLPANCGKAADDVCCNSPLVPGGSYYRSQDDATDGVFASGPLASVSSFRLDKYEVTVGRFRKFLEAGKGIQSAAPAAGEGANPYVPGSGWQSAWNTSLETSTSALETALSCDTNGDMRQSYTATAGAQEDLPINCVTWYEAFAFCAWDGGFVPTEAEWNYAAAGGAEQRAYPWSNPASSVTIGCAYANYDVDSGQSPNNHCVGGTLAAVQTVGLDTAGDGRWGQSDLAGNVHEYILDWFNPYQTPCIDCANLVQGSSTTRSNRGGAMFSAAPALRTALRADLAPDSRGVNFGLRCARVP